MPTEPWTSYPAEMNATRILGLGPQSWFASAAIWAAQAAQAAQAQVAFLGQVATQSGVSSGMTSLAVQAKASPFAAWLAYMEIEALTMSAACTTVGTSHVEALTSIVPLPAIEANRAMAAAANAAAAIDASAAPAAVQLEQQYVQMTIQNGMAMTSYDTAISTASAPKAFSAPPNLVDSIPAGTTSQLPQPQQMRVEQLMQQGQSMLQQGIGPLKSAASQASQQAGQFSTMPGQTPASGLAAAQSRMAPATGFMRQFSSPLSSGTLRNGLGSGSRHLAAPRLGGFRAGSGGAGLGGLRGGGLPLGAMAQPTTPLNAAAPGTGGLAKPGFTGIPPEARTSTGGLGGRTPLGAMPGGGSSKGTKRTDKTNAVEELSIIDPIAKAQKEQREARLFN